MAVADEQVLAHPTGHGEAALPAVLLGGAFLFIGGTMLFKRLSAGPGSWPLSHIVGLGLFALFGIWALTAHPGPLLLHMSATGLLLVVAVWEWGSFHGGWAECWIRLRAP